MNRNQKIGFAIMAVAVILPIVIERIDQKVQTKKHIAKIEAESTANIEAMLKAKAIVDGLFEKGYYRDRSIVDMNNDFEFYRIAIRFNE